MAEANLPTRTILEKADVIVIGAGHNALVAATLLARRGLAVTILEEKSEIGGATKTEKPFKRAPELSASTGAYLLGVMPPEILKVMGARVPLIRRDPHYFLPTQDNRFLLFGSDTEAMREQFTQHFTEQDWKANQALSKEIALIREDLAPSWLEGPRTATETADRYLRPELRKVFYDLVSKPVEEYLQRFGFESELLIAMYSVTDGFSGLNGSFGSPRTGMNFLVHNMCRLPGSDSTFMVVGGGMGTVAKEFARAAREAGVEIRVNAPVKSIIVENKTARGVVLSDGTEIRAKAVVAGCDPFRMRELVGVDQLPTNFNERLDGMKREGTTMKVNLALSRLPTFKCLSEDRGQFGATIHLLPQEKNVIASIKKGFEDVQKGKLCDTPTIEWYIHSQADPSMRDQQGNHSAAFFVQWVPYELKGTTWEKEETKYVNRLISIADEFAPGFKSSVVDAVALTPKKIEREFGIRYGHIHHIDNSFGFDKRMPYITPIEGLFACSAGCHPAGSVIGAAGHNSAQVVLKEMGLGES